MDIMLYCCKQNYLKISWNYCNFYINKMQLFFEIFIKNKQYAGPTICFSSS